MGINRASWGKPKLALGKWADDGGAPTEWGVIDYIVEGTTELLVNKGDKKEAKIEGGEVEAVRYSANTYELVFNVRLFPGRQLPFQDVDGFVEGKWAILLQPEDPKALGYQFDSCVLSTEDVFSSEDGMSLKVTASILKPASGATVKRKVIDNITTPSL